LLRLFTETLGAFLTSRLSHLSEKPVASFALPGSVAGENALSLFLAAMTEDEDLRSNDGIHERVGLEWVTKLPPVRLKCTYIVSAWPASSDPAESALAQLRLLSAAFKIFASIHTLPPGWLPEPFKAPGLPEPVISLAKDDLSASPEFWAATGCLFHSAFAFTATISLPADDAAYDHVVEDVLVDYELK